MNAAIRPSLSATTHSFELLESGEQYFPAVLASIAQAHSEVLIETFILFEDQVGIALQHALIAAAQRGVQIVVTIDGYGSPNLSEDFLQSLVNVGVRINIYDPHPPLLGFRTNVFRRLHRKLAVIDGEIAYVGGINYSIDQLANQQPFGKLDFAVRVTGPCVAVIHQFMRHQIEFFNTRGNIQPRQQKQTTITADVEFVVRDNDAHRDDIERRYRHAIHSAQREIIICNAYFFPGYRLLSALRRAARRGVQVSLVLQGAPDMPGVKRWEKLLYAPLLQAGVHIYEYVQHPLHAKVAVIDQQWSTVGSSNLDPLSLTLNLEANLVIRDENFCRLLRARLQQVVEHDCVPVTSSNSHGHNKLKILLQTAAYHATRHFPKLAGWLPAHIPKLHSLHKRDSYDINKRVLNRGSVS
jgi:cardiolipin synthase